MTISTGMWEVLQALAHRAYVDTRPGHWTPGKIAAVWSKYQPQVETMVRAEKLQAVQILAERVVAGPAAVEDGLVWWNPKGGWPLPHFHLGDNIYPANAEQWNRFSNTVLAKVGANLQNAKAKVSFDQFMQITDAAPQL